MIEDSSFESFAHYASGMASMSFVMWAVILYEWRKRNRMTFLLFLVVAYIALSFLKDAIFLWPSRLFSDFYFVENMVSIFDVSFVPLVCAFFLEATRPGTVTNKRLLLSFLSFIVFLPLYCLFHSQWVVMAVFSLSLLAALVTLVIVPINVIRYNKYLSDNYSFIKDLGVGWCTGCAFCFFLVLVFYQVCFYEPTWLGEMIYDTIFVITWNVVCLFTRNHQVVSGMLSFSEDDASQPVDSPKVVSVNDTLDDLPADKAAALLPSGGAAQSQKSDEPKPVAPSDSQLQLKDSFVADSLQRCMETDKLYLNPRLTLAELAQAAGTNKTYISTYINGQGKTFYDYVNEYRVAEACRIIDEKVAACGRLSMTDVASQSGFNSISTFNRYFSKLKGITPTNYSRRQH